MGKGGGNQTAGYRYYMGLHCGLCHGPVDALVDIRGGNLSFGLTSPVTASGEIYINQPGLYGGDKHEGGVQGFLDVMMGEATQGVNSYLQSVQGGIQNAYRGILSLVYRKGLIGSNNPYPKPWSFRVQRALQGWDGGTAWYAAKAAIPLGSFYASSVIWKYQEFTQGDSTNGSGTTFNDSSWASGKAPFGGFIPSGSIPPTGAGAPDAYGFSDLPATTVDVHKTIWLRTWISLGAVPSSITVQVYVDDSFVLYVNGTEVVSGDDSSGSYSQYTISGSAFTTGDNLIAVQYTDAGSGSPDRSWFDFRIVGLNAVVAMNPAHIVYECLTNRDWGMGYPTSIIDNDAFTAAADTHYSEGLGLCILWQQEDTIENFLQTIMDYTAGVLVQSKTTGLFQYNLIRGGYDTSTLPVFTRDNIIELTSIETPSITGATNEVVIRWFDPVTKTKQYTTCQNLAAIQAQGVIVSVTKDFPGIASQDLAAKIAQRELQGVSTPLKKLKLKLDRSAYALLPGGLFVLNFPDIGISSMVFRVGEVDYGTLTQGAISVTAVQDVFGFPSTTYMSPSYGANGTAWAAPSKIPASPVNYTGFEADYRSLYMQLSSSDLESLTTTAGYASVLVARPTSMSINYQEWSCTDATNYVERATDDFCPFGQLSAAIGLFDVTMTVTNGIDLSEVDVPCAALIDNEIVSVTAINTSTGVCTIARGCVDTVCAAHAANANVWFYDYYQGSDNIEYFQGETVSIKPCPATSAGVLAEASAPVISVPIAGRASLPYPPAAPKINGTRFDSVPSVSGSFTVSWAERNRLTQQDQLIDTTQATITPETNTRYFLGFYNSSGTLLVSENNIGTPTATVTLNYTGNVTMKLYSMNDNGSSQQEWVVVFAYTPPSGSPTNTITATAYTPVYNGTIIDGGTVS